jgi:tetratricopeptide (TPR) repeat protein
MKQHGGARARAGALGLGLAAMLGGAVAVAGCAAPVVSAIPSVGNAGTDQVEVARLQQRVEDLERQVAQLGTQRPVACAPAPAVASAEEAIELYEQATRALFEGRFRFAARAFQQIVDTDRRHGRAYRGLGLAVAELGERDRAIAALQEYMRLSRGGDAGERIHILERLRDLEGLQAPAR